MPENFRLEVPQNTPECALPVQPPNPMLDELHAIRKEPGSHMSPSFHKVTITGANGQHFESRLKSDGQEITNVITGQRDVYREQARLSSEFEIKDQNGLTTVKTIFGPESSDGKESIQKQTGERRGHDGAIKNKFEIDFGADGKATRMSCSDNSGKKIHDRPISSADWQSKTENDNE